MSQPSQRGSVPDRLGPYLIERELGSGAFGIVYLAIDERSDRRVALKVLRRENLGRITVARFRAEVEALRILADDTHQYFPRVAETGEFTDVPYAAMDYVAGGPIDSFCDERRLDVRERLRLFVEVCRAVGKAHQNGIVHRDLKPQHILVHEDDDGSRPLGPRVIDFGMARGVDFALDVEVHTAGAMIGTPGFLSPEQANGRRVTVQTDVYSLGVVLYLLLAGCMPRDREPDSGFSVAREAQTTLPPIDRRFAELAQGDAGRAEQTAVARSSSIDGLQRELRGDLRLIVQKATAPDRGHRYDTVVALASDIERYLDLLPITARKQSKLYAIRLLLRRRPGTVASTAGALLAVLLGIGWALESASAAKRSESLAAGKLSAEQLARAADLFSKAEIAAQRGRWRLALASYEQADTAGFVDKLLLGIRRVEALEGCYENQRARELLTELMARSDAHTQMARLLLLRADLGRHRFFQPDVGLEDAHESVKIHGEQPDALTPVERAYADSLLADKPREALGHLRRARSLDASNHRVNQCYAMTLILLGELEAAARFASAFQAQNPDDEEAHYVSLMMQALSDDQTSVDTSVETIAAKFGEDARDLAEAYVRTVRLIPWFNQLMRETFLARHIEFSKIAGIVLKLTIGINPMLRQLQDRREERRLRGLEDSMMRVPPSVARAFQNLRLLQERPFKMDRLHEAFGDIGRGDADAALILFDAMGLLVEKQGRATLQRLEDALASSSILVSKQVRLDFALAIGALIVRDTAYGLTEAERKTAVGTVTGWLRERLEQPMEPAELWAACFVARDLELTATLIELLMRAHNAEPEAVRGRMALVEAFYRLGSKDRARNLYAELAKNSAAVAEEHIPLDEFEELGAWINRDR